MDKQRGLEILTDVVKNNLRHQDYEHVTELSDKYYAMKTGDGICDLLKQIVTRETKEEFQQRKDITKSVVPSILNSTMLPFQKAIRKQPLLREIVSKKKDDLEKSIATFWGEKNLDEYLEYSVIDYNYTDPNAFLITEFDEFDPKKEKASPYPFVATSKEAIMFEYKNEILQYLIVLLPIKYMEKDAEKDGEKYTMYLTNDTIQLTQVAIDYVPEEGETVITIEEGARKFLYEEFEPKAGKVPAVRFGYMRDAETKGRTFVSVFHPVLLLLEKMMKVDSELDLTTAMTAFPQRFAYVDKCSNKDCIGGKLLSGGECPTCNGTGQQTLHRTVADVLTFTLPRNLEEMMDLDKMLVYKFPPTEILSFNKDWVKDLRILVHQMMFNNEIATRSETAVNVTATEKNFGSDNMNDTLYPFARNYSSIWEFVVKDIATFTDNGDKLFVHHKFPSDFKMKGITELMIELKQAKDAGASTSTIAAIEDDINAILYSDRPTDLKKIKVKSQINPFRGYNESSVRLLISQRQTTQYNAVLYANLESIFNELELEDPEIYDYEITKIRDMVKAKVEDYAKQIESEKPEPVEQPNFGA